MQEEARTRYRNAILRISPLSLLLLSAAPLPFQGLQLPSEPKNVINQFRACCVSTQFITEVSQGELKSIWMERLPALTKIH